MAKSVAQIANLPIENHDLYRIKTNKSQTIQKAKELWSNTQGIFQVKHPERFKNKHILLLDDVLTTGSTVESAVSVLSACENIRISIFTLAIA